MFWMRWVDPNLWMAGLVFFLWVSMVLGWKGLLKIYASVIPNVCRQNVLGFEPHRLTTFCSGSQIQTKPCWTIFDWFSLKFIPYHWVVDVTGYKVSAWNVVLSSVFDVQTHQELLYLQIKLTHKSHERVKLESFRTSSDPGLQNIWQCKVTEQIIETPDFLNFTRAQEML